RLTAADVNGLNGVDTVDAIAIQRFFLGLSTGIDNAGKYKFTPGSRSYPTVGTNQTSQDYDALVFGDVASGFIHRPEGSASDQPVGGENTSQGTAPVTTVTLPNAAVDLSQGNFIAALTSSEIRATDKLIGFQGDFTFDERMITFQEPAVQNAGLTAGNWNVSANVLAGPGPVTGPIKTLRISAFSL